MSTAQSESQTESAARRRQGSYYTPRFVVRYMLDGCLRPALRECSPLDRPRLRILDPACGDGAFLLEAFDVLHDWYRDESSDQVQLTTDERLRIVRAHLFGVDVDRRAIESLRDALFDRVIGTQKPTGGNPWVPPGAAGGLCRLGGSLALPEIAAIHDVVQRNTRVGDALTGPDFAIPEPVLFETKPADSDEPGAVDFRHAFPQVVRDGGFDVVVGNPPYRRELNAKGLFDRIAASPLGKKWRQARMDLWYYFLHRGLDLLRPGGRLSFVVNSYWTASSGAGKLIARLNHEATFEEILLLGDAPVFEDVAGRHLIFRLQSGRHSRNCRVIDLADSRLQVDEALDRLADGRDRPNGLSARCYHLSRRELYRHGNISLRRPDSVLDSMRVSHTLADSYEVRQGMAENPPAINARLNREFGNRYRVGEGVFVLTAEEIETLALSQAERQFLRPYFPTSVLGRYCLPDAPPQSVLYLTPTTAPSLERCPRLREHLERFRPILQRRRETRHGVRAWWQLHWPREERLFTEPRILSVQMGQVPQFVWADRPTFVGFSVNLILAATTEALPLPALCGILNSSLARRWFSAYAKRRGVNLEINGGLLRQFPLPAVDATITEQLEKLVTERHALSCLEEDETAAAGIARIEQAIDDLVFQLYRVRPECS